MRFVCWFLDHFISSSTCLNGFLLVSMRFVYWLLDHFMSSSLSFIIFIPFIFGLGLCWLVSLMQEVCFASSFAFHLPPFPLICALFVVLLLTWLITVSPVALFGQGQITNEKNGSQQDPII